MCERDWHYIMSISSAGWTITTLKIYENEYWKCNLPMSNHVRLLLTSRNISTDFPTGRRQYVILGRQLDFLASISPLEIELHKIRSDIFFYYCYYILWLAKAGRLVVWLVNWLVLVCSSISLSLIPKLYFRAQIVVLGTMLVSFLHLFMSKKINQLTRCSSEREPLPRTQCWSQKIFQD